MAGEHLGEGALAAAVATHHRVDFTGTDREIHPFEDGLVLNTGMEITDLQQHGGVGSDHGNRRGERRRKRKGNDAADTDTINPRNLPA